MQLQRGKYQTRTNRIVEITGSKTELRQKPGIAQPVPTRMWAGVLFQMDGKTPESQYTWTDAGGFFGTAQGVASPHDLVNLVSSAEPEGHPVEEVNASEHSLRDSESKVERLTQTIRLIRLRAVQGIEGDTAEAALQQVVDLTNEVLQD